MQFLGSISKLKEKLLLDLIFESQNLHQETVGLPGGADAANIHTYWRVFV